MIGVAVLPQDPQYVPVARLERSDEDGELFGVVELVGMPGWATINLGGFETVEQQRRYLVALSLATERLAVELNNERAAAHGE